MTRDAFAVSSMLVLLALNACSTGPRTGSSGGHEPGVRTITIGSTILDPPDLTMRAEQTLALNSIAGTAMQLEFIGPKTGQASKITCRPKDPAKAKGAEAAWTTISTNGEGHLVANIPPGPWGSTCSLAVGNYVYRVTALDTTVNPGELKTGMEGTITVK